jgi:hypothetical protein
VGRPRRLRLHAYLAGVIAGSLRHLAYITPAWPGEDSQWPTGDDWEAAMRHTADVFDQLRSTGHLTSQQSGALADEARASLRQMWFHLGT